MAPRTRLYNKARNEPILLPSKLQETWGPAVCHSFIYVPRGQHKGQTDVFSQKTLSVDSPHADSGDSEHANQRMLCICCLQTPHSSHPVCAAALQRNIPFTAPPPWSRKEHDISTWMGNTLAASGVFTTKLETGEAHVGSIQGTSLTSRMFRDPDSLKEGLQRKFICRLNTH